MDHSDYLISFGACLALWRALNTFLHLSLHLNEVIKDKQHH